MGSGRYEIACPDCGYRPPRGGLACNHLRDSLLARDFSEPSRWQWHRLAVDAYCLQHGPCVASAKSLAAHLCGILIAFERGNNEQLLRQLQRWLSTNPPIRKPELPVNRGELTIGSLHHAPDSLQYGESVERWARSAWKAYAPLHALAREWLAVGVAADCANLEVGICVVSSLLTPAPPVCLILRTSAQLVFLLARLPGEAHLQRFREGCSARKWWSARKHGWSLAAGAA